MGYPAIYYIAKIYYPLLVAVGIPGKALELAVICEASSSRYPLYCNIVGLICITDTA